jgi:biotin-dependent carboxylase-like uncharacterized protein
MIEIITPGPLATIQDQGRVGYFQMGVGFCGAMDMLALKIANRLAGNDEKCPAIEFTIGSFEVRFLRDTTFALAGADCRTKLDGVDVTPLWCMTAKSGQILKASAPAIGMRTYLSVAGGFDIKPVLGSFSTDLKGGFGGLDGKPLKSGDRLYAALSAKHGEHLDFGISPDMLKQVYDVANEEATTVRYIAASEHDAFTETSIATFQNDAWTIQPDSNRIGYRLSGRGLELRQTLELRSHGIIPGTIQVPPSGQPVIQLSDANTCGGYPKMGVVASVDLWRLGQARLGSKLRFKRISRDEGVRLLQERDVHLAKLFSRLDDAKKVLA